MMKKSILKVVLGAVFCLPLVLTSCNDVFGQMDNASTETKLTVTYYVWDPTEQKLVEKTSTDDVTVITSSTTSWSGLCFVNENVTIDGDVTLTGDVTLVVADGVNLTVNGQVVNAQYNLSLYGQKEKTGQFVVYNPESGYSVSVKELEIGGLNVNVTAKYGHDGHQAIEVADKVVVYDGVVTATGKQGLFSQYGDIEILGGTLNMTTYDTSIYGTDLTFSNCKLDVTGEGDGGIGVISGTNVLIKTDIKEIRMTNTGVTESSAYQMGYWLNIGTSLKFGENADICATWMNSDTKIAAGFDYANPVTGFTIKRGSGEESKVLSIKPNA